MATWSGVCRLESRDEVGDLAQDLNAMAAQLEENFHDLEEAERKYRGIFENSVEGIFQTDSDGTMLAANPRLAEILGAPQRQTISSVKTRSAFYADHAACAGNCWTGCAPKARWAALNARWCAWTAISAAGGPARPRGVGCPGGY